MLFYHRDAINSYFKALGYNVVMPIYNDTLVNDHIEIASYSGTMPLATIHITVVPHCCGSIFISNLHCYEIGKGHGYNLLNLVLTKFAEWRYSQVTCIIPTHMKEAQHVFKKAGFKKLIGTRVVNKRSNNTYYTWVRNI